LLLLAAASGIDRFGGKAVKRAEPQTLLVPDHRRETAQVA
jgi:hypothetical protein